MYINARDSLLKIENVNVNDVGNILIVFYRKHCLFKKKFSENSGVCIYSKKKKKFVSESSVTIFGLGTIINAY